MLSVFVCIRAQEGLYVREGFDSKDCRFCKCKEASAVELNNKPCVPDRLSP